MDDARASQELDTINQKADYLTDQSVEATRRMKALVVETENVGANTMVTLLEQGEQLDNIENKMDDIDAELKEAERDLNQLERCCGLCLCCNAGNKFAKTHQAQRDSAFNARSETTVAVRASGTSARGAGTVPNSSGPMIEKVLNDDREQEMEENLNDVSNVLGNLKNMALDMGDELERQNHQLDRINAKAECNELRLDAANVQAKRIAK